jgi:hypothetical protein
MLTISLPTTLRGIQNFGTFHLVTFLIDYRYLLLQNILNFNQSNSSLLLLFTKVIKRQSKETWVGLGRRE